MNIYILIVKVDCYIFYFKSYFFKVNYNLFIIYNMKLSLIALALALFGTSNALRVSKENHD